MCRQPLFQITLNGREHSFLRPQVMGILNVTPDSFYEGSRMQTEREIASRAAQILAEGASMIDIGACSTRPGSTPASEKEEMERLRMALPIIRGEHPEAILSIDTFRPQVARMCAEEYGASIINDVSEGSDEMFRMVGRLQTAYVLMSAKPDIEAMAESFSEKIQRLNECGCNSILLDPGYGFGKTLEQNYSILKEQERLLSFGLPLLIGVSRKRMIWQQLGTSPAEALNGTTAVHTISLLHGAHILRVHDVREAMETIKITEACS